VTRALRRSVTSLAVPNYRRYFLGQVVSLSGNWMQIVAEAWLVLALTGSGTMVGLTAALQFAPMLLFGAFGGMLADRVPKRRLLMATQAAMAVPALMLWALAASGEVEAWMVLALAFVRGSVNAIDNPARQSFAIEMVGAERVVNAVGLNSVLIHTARIAGPAAAGLVIATWGVEPCFLINALSFAAMLLALRAMDPRALDAPAPVAREPGAVRAALAYVRATPELRIPLLAMAVVGTFAFNFQVILPLFARFTFAGDASAYAALVSAMGVGSVIGALVTSARGRIGPAFLTGSAGAFGALTLALAAAPTLGLALGAIVPLGAASVMFAAGVNSSLQLAVEPAMRGRVMALYSVVFLGSTPIGGPLAGWLSEVASPRAALLLAGVAAAAAAGGAATAFRRAARAPSRPPSPERSAPPQPGECPGASRPRRALARAPRPAEARRR
jgi:MFS family permease